MPERSSLEPQRIFITGASGCIGHYIVDELLKTTPHHLFLLLRDPSRLRLRQIDPDRVTILPGNLYDIEQFADVLQSMDTVILVATAWGGDDVAYDINVLKTLQLLKLLDPAQCRQVLYFSTASILGRDNKPLFQAGQMGTGYVRSKYLCHQQIPKLAIAPHVTTLFPTLVFGGAEDKPYSQISNGLADVLKWIGVIRFIRADGSFHLIHAADIARVVGHLVDHPPQAEESRELVLGLPALTANEAIARLSHYLGKRIYVRIPLFVGLANLLIKIFQIQMAPWDRFCLDYRHFTYQNPVSPATFGLPTECATLEEILQASGIPPTWKSQPPALVAQNADSTVTTGDHDKP
jgi:nucleoside-diphosphate-sugar epimerase